MDNKGLKKLETKLNATDYLNEVIPAKEGFLIDILMGIKKEKMKFYLIWIQMKKNGGLFVIN